MTAETQSSCCGTAANDHSHSHGKKKIDIIFSASFVILLIAIGGNRARRIRSLLQGAQTRRFDAGFLGRLGEVGLPCLESGAGIAAGSGQGRGCK